MFLRHLDDLVEAMTGVYASFADSAAGTLVDISLLENAHDRMTPPDIESIEISWRLLVTLVHQTNATIDQWQDLQDVLHFTLPTRSSPGLAHASTDGNDGISDIIDDVIDDPGDVTTDPAALSETLRALLDAIPVRRDAPLATADAAAMDAAAGSSAADSSAADSSAARSEDAPGSPRRRRWLSALLLLVTLGSLLVAGIASHIADQRGRALAECMKMKNTCASAPAPAPEAIGAHPPMVDLEESLFVWQDNYVMPQSIDTVSEGNPLISTVK